MKKLIIYFFALLFSVWFGIIMYRNSGYVLISYQNLTIEASLWLMVGILLVLFILFYILLRLNSNINFFIKYCKMWFSNVNKNRARIKTTAGLCHLIEGDWRLGEKKLVRAAKYSDMPLVNYLAAAFMAQRQRAFVRRDEYMLFAQKADAQHSITVATMQAQLQIFNCQWEEALATLQHLRKLKPKNDFIMQLLKQVYLELNDWYGLKSLLPILRKRRVLSVEEIEKLELKVYSELFLASKKNHTIANIWHELSRHLQKQPILVAYYVEYLLENKQNEEAEDIIKRALHLKLDNCLLKLYAILPSGNPIKKIARAEKWLKANPENAALLLCLGCICKQQKLWGKAKQYLEKSLLLAPTQAVYLELGQLMELQNELPAAVSFYKQAFAQHQISK
jgi:HemY protein